MKQTTILHKQKLKPHHWWTLLGLSLLPLISVTHLFCIRFEAAKLALILIAFVAIASIASYIQVARDKKKAQAGEWRITEAHLHLLEFIGGWPGSFLAQKRFRHKTSHLAYQAAFWIVVSVHQICAVEYLFNGPISSSIVRSLADLLP